MFFPLICGFLNQFRICQPWTYHLLSTPYPPFIPKYLFYSTSFLFQFSFLGPQVWDLHVNLVSFLLIGGFWAWGPRKEPVNARMWLCCDGCGHLGWQVFLKRRKSDFLHCFETNLVLFPSMSGQKRSLHFQNHSLPLNPAHIFSRSPPQGLFTFIDSIFLNINLCTNSFPWHLNMK